MTTNNKSINFYGKMLTFSRLKLDTNDLKDIESYLETISPNKDSKIPVIIDSTTPQELEKLVDLLWSFGLQPIGVVTGEMDDQAEALKLAIFPADGNRMERVETQKQKKTSKNESATAKSQETSNVKPSGEDNNSLVYEQMLRSGQSLNHVGGDLVLTQGINDGAEAITDNNLHIYGHGQGRLVAGATGDKNSHIFCQQFNPSLVSVAGTYCLRDSIPQEVLNKAVQVSYVENEGLIFQVMETSD